MDFAPTYENSTKKFLKASVPKAYKAGLSIKKKAVQVHDLTAEESASPERRILLEESSHSSLNVCGSIHSSTPVKNIS